MPKDTAEKPFVFVLMPFRDEIEDIYKLGIKETCEKAGCRCERVDEQSFKQTILQQIYEQIKKADIIVAELSEKNVNVYYELGYAHCIPGKTVILLAKNEDQIPFDLKPYQHVVYHGKIVELQEKLEKKLKWAIEESKKKSAKAAPQPSEDRIEEIKWLLGDIDSLRGLSDKEIIGRKVGNIKRLIELDVKPLSLERINLEKAELQGTNLSRVNLSRADLRKANLNTADLKGANLQEGDLCEAYLYRTDFQGANLRAANLGGANLQEADLRETYLEGTDLQGVDLRGAKLEKAILQRTNLKKAKLQGASIQGAILREVDLSGAKDITFEQLSQVKSLYNVKGLASEIEAKLRKEKPELFE